MNIFIHTRDLRIEDNTTLHYFLTLPEPLISIFCLDKEQLARDGFTNVNAVSFMIESLIELKTSYKDKNLSFYVLYGSVAECILNIAKSYKISKIGINQDYTPFATKRMENLIKFGYEIISLHDHLLIGEPTNVVNKSGQCYQVFTPFYNTAKNSDVRKVFMLNIKAKAKKN